MLLIVALVLVVTTVTRGRDEPPPHDPNRASAPLPADFGFKVMHTYGQAGTATKHTGEDFSVAQGTPVLSVMDGEVVEPISEGWIGTNVVVAHRDGSHTLYGQLSALDVQPGMAVTAGQPIGKVGATGNSFAPHLHLEYYPAGLVPGVDKERTEDPIAFLREHGVQL